MKMFTISSGRVSHGVKVKTLRLAGSDIEIPAIIVGEEGRGRQSGVLPISLPSALHGQWKKGEEVKIFTASVGTTKAGKPKLFASTETTSSDEEAILVFETKIGFRGGNCHSGDSTGEDAYLPFPGKILATGMIAQGDAGRMGSGEQIVAVMPKESIFRTGYSGRLYGCASSHFYKWDGSSLLGGITPEDREVSDLF